MHGASLHRQHRFRAACDARRPHPVIQPLRMTALGRHYNPPVPPKDPQASRGRQQSGPHTPCAVSMSTGIAKAPAKWSAHSVCGFLVSSPHQSVLGAPVFNRLWHRPLNCEPPSRCHTDLSSNLPPPSKKTSISTNPIFGVCINEASSYASATLKPQRGCIS
jgi:hypothetical protein